MIKKLFFLVLSLLTVSNISARTSAEAGQEKIKEEIVAYVTHLQDLGCTNEKIITKVLAEVEKAELAGTTLSLKHDERVTWVVLGGICALFVSGVCYGFYALFKEPEVEKEKKEKKVVEDQAPPRENRRRQNYRRQNNRRRDYYPIPDNDFREDDLPDNDLREDDRREDDRRENRRRERPVFGNNPRENVFPDNNDERYPRRVRRAPNRFM